MEKDKLDSVKSLISTIDGNMKKLEESMKLLDKENFEKIKKDNIENIKKIENILNSKTGSYAGAKK